MRRSVYVPIDVLGNVTKREGHQAARVWEACCSVQFSSQRHTAASLAIRSGANIKALQNMLDHTSAGLTLDRYGHLSDSDVDAVGHAINEVITVLVGTVWHMACGQPSPTRGQCR